MSSHVPHRILWPALPALVLVAAFGVPRTAAAIDEFRGMWVTRFEWPQPAGSPTETATKAYIDEAMAKLAASHFNAVLFQVRGQGDTLYPSPYEPWSELIAPTGADPGWDPLAYALRSAHDAGLEFHAYINAHVAWQQYPRTGEDIIVDNGGAGFAVLSGTWGTASYPTAYPTPSGNCRTRATTATVSLGEVEWRPTLPADDWYDVSVWFPASAPGAITNAQYTVYYSGGSQTVSVNQTTNGGQWNVISTGKFFTAGTSCYVKLSNSSASVGTVYADAVRFRRLSPSDPTHMYWQHCNALDPAHRDWLLHPTAGAAPGQYSGGDTYVWIAPGVPAFQAYWRKQVMYVVQNYDVDGLHFDRIRTPTNLPSHDPITEARFAGEGNPDRLSFEDWTRTQITRMLCDLYAQVAEVRPRIKLSSSPLGLYSQDRYPGYPSTFQYGYTKCFQDAQGWLAAGAQDFIVPMIYWGNGGSLPDYDDVLPDWVADNAGRHVYGGQAAYKTAEMTLAEMTHQVEFTRQVGGQGNVPFSYTSFTFWNEYVAPGGVYEQVAHVPPMPWKDNPTTAILLGTITTGGTPVVDACVTRSGSNYKALSSADGLYSFLLVPPGTYTLTISKNGIAPRTVSGVTVAAGDVRRVDVSLGPDFDNDGDVDLADFGHLQTCFNGPNAPAKQATCLDADLDQDADVDLADFGVFQNCFNGPNRPGRC